MEMAGMVCYAALIALAGLLLVVVEQSTREVCPVLAD